MAFVITSLPQFRDAEADGRIATRGYMNWFQDAATGHFHQFGKGNDVIIDAYGLGWLATRYNLVIESRADFSGPVESKVWIESQKSPVRLVQYLIITQGGELRAKGAMEMCIANVAEGKVARLSEIDFPTNLAEHLDIETPRLQRIRFTAEGADHAYTYHVRYSDIDNNLHMNNLHYVDLALNAFNTEFHMAHPTRSFEIEYIAQCHEGDAVEVFKREAEPGVWEVTGMNGDELCTRVRLTVD
ncbi:acyl-[acyl-carrier-protein] thioesterase [Slackia heliotrinireducens]|uniref:acyl-[acyl-carrier-protein] thioesterase n=1 Tax=Slackia heliotrinireducens TaxID=84110 RepID=UPI003314D1E0